MEEKSLCELMEEAFLLSLNCAYETICPNGNFFDSRKQFPCDENLIDKIYGWADGLTQKYYFDVTNGHCSPAMMINFDLEKFEENVKFDIRLMTDILAICGLPKRLTREEMIERGYRGY